MSIISPEDLEASPLADLHALASTLAIDGFRRLRKPDLVGAILTRQGGAAVAQEPPRAPRAPRRRRGRGAREGDGGEAGGETASAPRTSDAAAKGAAPAGARREETPKRDRTEQLGEGVVELLPNGSGFMRVRGPEASEDDVYISAAQARRCELVAGDRISGPVRPARRSERHPSLVRIDSINGVPAEEAVRGTRVEEMDADFPSEPLALAASDETLAAVDAAAPFGRGSRVVLAGPPRSGRSELIRRIAAALGATAGLEIELLVVGARPEEVSELRELEHVRAAALSFAAPSDAQDAAVEQAVERGRRIAVRGGDAVLLIDALDGVGAAASRRALASARNLRGAGSLTIIAAARAPIGGESTLITLRRDGQFPALDAENSWTVRAELLLAAAPKPKPKRARAPRRKPAAAAEAQDGE